MKNKIRYHGWHWYFGVGNDRDVEGNRPSSKKWWVVLCWTHDGVGYASSACWVSPLTQDEMDQGRWGEEIIPSYYDKAENIT